MGKIGSWDVAQKKRKNKQRGERTRDPNSRASRNNTGPGKGGKAPKERTRGKSTETGATGQSKAETAHKSTRTQTQTASTWRPHRTFHLSLLACRYLGRRPFSVARFWGRRPGRTSIRLTPVDHLEPEAFARSWDRRPFKERQTLPEPGHPEGNTTHKTPFDSIEAGVNQHPVDTLGPVDYLKPEDFLGLTSNQRIFGLASNQKLFGLVSNQRPCTLTSFITPTAYLVQKLELVSRTA